VKYFFLLLLISNFAWAQLLNTVELTEKLSVSDEAAAQKELLHKATLKSFEKFIPALGYKYNEFDEKLDAEFKEYFNNYKEKKIIEKFGASHKTNLSETERAAFLNNLDKEKHDLFIQFSRTAAVLRSHSIAQIQQNEKDPFTWTAKINLDVDKIKLERFLNKIMKGENKPFSKIIIITEINSQDFTWPDLGLDNEKVFTNPLNNSWLKWFNENPPSTVEEVVLCDEACMNYYIKWSETQLSQISVPEEYRNSVFLIVNMQVKRVVLIENLQEIKFEWQGRTLLHDLATKRILESFTLPTEKRTFRQLDQKAINSGLVSSLYRSPLTAFMQFSKKLEEKVGFNRVSKLVIKGYRHIGDVMALNETLKTRGTSLGLNIDIESFSKDEANLLCFYRGEEKSFTDILSGLKEVKSTHGYTLVNEFTGVHHVIKFVTE
jgi:hypothetical protein